MVKYRRADDAQVVDPRLVTPRVAGYRSGMSATGLIGRRLANVYDIASDVPSSMGTLLDTLEVKTEQSR